MVIVSCDGVVAVVGVVVCVSVGVGSGSQSAVSLPYRLAGCRVHT